MSIEMTRILALPVKDPITDEEVEALSKELIQKEPYEGRCKCGNKITCGNPSQDVPLKPLRLLQDQAAGVKCVRKYGRMFGDIKVGGGKTALAYLIAAEIFKVKPDARIVYLLPPNLVKALRMRHEPWARRHLKGWIPRWVHYHGKPARLRTTYARARNPGVHVIPYSLLSEKDAPTLLDWLNADFVIADEGHTISGEARTGRNAAFWNWLDQDRVKGAVMSGTLTSHSLRDHYRLARWVLGVKCPMPRTFVDLEKWNEVMRSDSEKDKKIDRGTLRQFRHLVKWASRKFPEDMRDMSESARTVRNAFRLRFNSAPGVVSSAGQAPLGVGLEINNWPVGEPNEELQGLLDQLDTNWLTPDGELLTYAVEKQEVFRQLTCGFYLHHYWDMDKPRVEEAIEAWEARIEYRAELRNFLKSTRAKHMKLYIPSAVGKHHETKGAIKNWDELYDLWKRWKSLQKPDLPDRSTKFVKVDDYKVKGVLEWAKRHKKHGGVIWFRHLGFAQWCYRTLQKAGLRPVLKESGDSWLIGDGSDGKIVLASSGFLEGHNLQHYKDQLISQWFRPAKKTQQLLGRLHREGQTADTVRTDTLLATEFDHMQVAATLLDTIYVKQIQGGDPKLLVAEWGEEPREYPADFLRERGFSLQGECSEDEDEQGDED